MLTLTEVLQTRLARSRERISEATLVPRLDHIGRVAGIGAVFPEIL